MIAALLLDLDGTLLDTPSAITRTLHQVLGEIRGDIDPEAVRATIGKPLDTSVAGLLGREVSDPVVDEAISQYRRSFAETVLPRAREIMLPGVIEGLTRARAEGLRLAVATSKVRASTLPLLEASGLDRFLDGVSCHDMVERGKPHPDLAHHAADSLGVPAGQCAVVGDSADDMRMARNAGMAALGVTTGVGSEDALIAGGAHGVRARFDEAVDWLLEQSTVLTA